MVQENDHGAGHYGRSMSGSGEYGSVARAHIQHTGSWPWLEGAPEGPPAQWHLPYPHLTGAESAEAHGETERVGGTSRENPEERGRRERQKSREGGKREGRAIQRKRSSVITSMLDAPGALHLREANLGKPSARMFHYE